MSPWPFQTPKRIQRIKIPEYKPLAGKVLKITLGRMLSSSILKIVFDS